jgi:hypothetical protein
VPIQAVLKDLVAGWVKINSPINAQPEPAARQPARPAVAYAAIPKTQETRENTGLNEPVRTLMKIDSKRAAAKKNGSTFAD